MKTKKSNVNKPFYHRLIQMDRIYLAVKRTGLTGKQETELIGLIEETFHTRVLDSILEKLPLEKHEEFLEKFNQKPHDLSLWKFMDQEFNELQENLRKTLSLLEEEILKDLQS